MSILTIYQNMLSALRAQIRDLASNHGVSPDFRGDKTLFLLVDAFDLSIDGKAIAFIDSNVALDNEGYEYNIECFEENGELGKLVDTIDQLTKAFAEDEQSDLIYIRGYRSEEDMDAQNSEHIDAIPQESWDNGEGVALIEYNEPNFYHIEAVNEDGKLVS